MSIRIGLLVPSSNTTMEPDFYRHIPEDVSVYTARMHLRDVTVAAEEIMLDEHFPVALHDIATIEPDVVVFGCTSAGALRGNEYDAELIRCIEQVIGGPAISVVQSVQAELQRHGRRVHVLTPYIDEVTDRVAAALAADGAEVVACAGMGIKANADIGRVSPEQIAAFAAEQRTKLDATVDCLFLSCTNWQAMAVREQLQRELQLPVVTSNHATLMATLAAVDKGAAQSA